MTPAEKPRALRTQDETKRSLDHVRIPLPLPQPVTSLSSRPLLGSMRNATGSCIRTTIRPLNYFNNKDRIMIANIS